jgi:hypothetical protein
MAASTCTDCEEKLGAARCRQLREFCPYINASPDATLEEAVISAGIGIT